MEGNGTQSNGERADRTQSPGAWELDVIRHCYFCHQLWTILIRGAPSMHSPRTEKLDQEASESNRPEISVVFD